MTSVDLQCLEFERSVDVMIDCWVSVYSKAHLLGSAITSRVSQ